MKRAMPMLLLLGGCPADPVAPPEPVDTADCLVLTPPNLDFAHDYDLSGQVERTPSFENRCDVAIEGVEVVIKGPQRSLFEVGRVPAVLEPLQAWRAPVVFLGTEPGDAVAQIQASYDGGAVIQEIGLEGLVYGPSLLARPERLDLGRVSLGCEVTTTVEVVNEGSARANNLTVVPEGVTLTKVPSTLAARSGVAEIGLSWRAEDQEPLLGSITVGADGATSLVIPVQATVTSEATQVDFAVAPPQDHDVLFVFERAGGNSDVNADLQAGIGVLVDAFSKADATLHLAAAVADDGCVVGGTSWIDEDFSSSEAARAFEVMGDASRVFAPYGSLNEKGFAIARANRSDACSEDFWRAGSTWHIVHVANGDETSSISGADQAAWWRGQHAEPDRARIHTVVPSLAGCPRRDPATAYLDAAHETGGTQASWCAAASDQLDQLIEAIGPMPTPASLQLSKPPVIDTLEIRLSGTVLPADAWSYDVERQQVDFADSVRVRPGAIVQATYLPQAPCP